MRFFIVIFLFFQYGFSQEIDFNPPKNSIEISESLEPFVEEFIEEALERGFYVRFYLMEKIDYIYLVDNMPVGKLGFVGEDERGFYVSSEIENSSLQLRLTIFHEIGHILKGSGDHVCYSCDSIMAEYYDKELFEEMEDEVWEEKLDEYFKWLNNE